MWRPWKRREIPENTDESQPLLLVGAYLKHHRRLYHVERVDVEAGEVLLENCRNNSLTSARIEEVAKWDVVAQVPDCLPADFN